MSVFFYLFVILFLIAYPDDTAQSALQAMRIWSISIVPVLFPYMLFSRLLCRSLQTLNLPEEPATAALGLLGGSPSGAAMIASHAQFLSPKSIYPLCAMAGTISPMFILGTIRTWTNSESLSRRLLFCHWLSALSCAGIACCKKPGKAHRIPSPLAVNSAVSPIAQSIDAILQVGGCVICYSVLASIMAKCLYPFSTVHPLIHAALEVSGGAHAIWQSSLPVTTKGILLSAALGFGGLSIITQNHALLKPIGISMWTLIRFALLRCLLSAASMALSLLLSPIS